MSLNQTVENVYLRQDAVQLTRKHFWRLLGMAAIIYAVTTGLAWLLTWIGDQLLAAETAAVVTTTQQYMNSTTITSADPMQEALRNLFTSPKYLLYNLVYLLLTLLVSSGMNLGQSAQIIQAGRGHTPKVMGVFGHMRHCLKAFGLNLLTGLKVVLWLLPGLLAVVVGAELTLYDYSELGALAIIGGIILMFILGAQAALRYAMASRILADEPDRGVRECVTLSKGLMNGRKPQFFKLGVPILGKAFGVALLVSTVGELILMLVGLDTDPTAAEILSSLCEVATIYFFLQLNMVSALFYIKRYDVAPDAPVSYWLRKEEPAADESPDTPADLTVVPPEDITPETNEKKENYNEQPDC